MPVNPSWYTRKAYPHFDLPLSEKDATTFVSDPIGIAHHSFYPLITYTLRTPRVRKDRKTGNITNEPKKRSIAYPSHKDGYVFSYYKSLLGKPYEQWLHDNNLESSVTAFRSIGENNITLAKKVFDFVKANSGCQIIATDVEGFFDNMNHQTLKSIWARFLNRSQLPDDHYAVYKAVTRYGVVKLHKLYNLFGLRIAGRANRGSGPNRICTPQQFREKVIARNLVWPGPGRKKGIGIPQGTSLSPLLSNMYMADLDLALYRWTTFLGGRYWRYCDDILIVLPGDCEVDILAYLDWWLKRLKISRSTEKTQVRNEQELPAKQLQYLGFLFNGSKITVRSSSIHRYHRKLKKAIQATKFRQNRESKGKPQTAPFRKQALYNMYSELSLRGKKIKAMKRSQKYQGNFTHYMEKSANTMDSPAIRRQRKRLLKKFREQISQHSRQ